MKKILITIALFSISFIASNAQAATFYIDCQNGSDASAGTATTSAWRTFSKFTTATNNPGDTAFVRGGNYGLASPGNTTDVSDCHDTTGAALNFTSDGSIGNPITLSRDYCNGWAMDCVTSTRTWTTTYGSKAIQANAAIDVAMLTASSNPVVYISGDNNVLFSYEVATAANTTVTLYLPYTGTNVGSGKTLVVLPPNPVWGASTTNILISTDDFWSFIGLTATSNNANGVIAHQNSAYATFRNMDVQPNSLGGSANNPAWSFTVGNTTDHVSIYNSRSYLSPGAGVSFTNGMNYYITGSLFDSGGITGGNGTCLRFNGTASGFIENSECKNFSTNIINFSAAYDNAGAVARVRNMHTTSTVWVSDSRGGIAGFEDYLGMIGYNSSFAPVNLNGTTAQYPMLQSATSQSDGTSILRAGGGSTDIMVTPTTSLSTVWDFSKYKLFEYPIYATTAARTYQVYFSVTSASTFTANPTAGQLYIEADYWGTTGNNAARQITKSSGTVDFSLTTWQALSVNVAPAQNGVLYLRGWYAKPQESAKSNQFFIDGTPIIQ